MKLVLACQWVRLLQVQKAYSLGIDPIVDYFFPIWPSINCFAPERSDNSQVTPSASFAAYLLTVQNKASQFTETGLFFTAQWVHQITFIAHM
jgi:hypothetical protein